MKSQRRLLVSALVMLVTFVCFSQPVGAQRSSGRGGGGTGINISKIRLGTEYVDGEVKGGYGNQIFRPKDHVILCVASISNPSADAKYKFVWLYYDAAARGEKQIFEQELTNQTDKDVVGKLSSTKDWPLGHYRVEIWVDGRRLQQRPMTIMTGD
jgi:hypothetical protein